jgi:hypothetical protein
VSVPAGQLPRAVTLPAAIAARLDASLTELHPMERPLSPSHSFHFVNFSMIYEACFDVTVLTIVFEYVNLDE